MPGVRRARAFTLIEAMIVVVIVGVLAVLATVAYRKWILSSYTAEAQDMLTNIRTAEESFRAENGGYLGVAPALSKANLYPSTSPKATIKTAWGGTCAVAGCNAAWATLNVAPNGPVRFGYTVVAGSAADTPPSPAGIASLAGLAGQPWYVAEAICDVDEDTTTPDTTLYATSAGNQIVIINEGH
jgi:prepilin-type N-terminal cleavage/methylation domain-containing protein